MVIPPELFSMSFGLVWNSHPEATDAFELIGKVFFVLYRTSGTG